MELISYTDSRQLVGALRQIIKDVYGNNESPNNAIVKIADEAKFQPEFVRRLCEAFNRASADIHRKRAADDTEKISPYPLANSDEILDTLYPDMTIGPDDNESDSELNKLVDDDKEVDEKQATEIVYVGDKLALAEVEPDYSVLEKAFGVSVEQQKSASDDDKLCLKKIIDAEQASKEALDESFIRATNMKFALHGAVKRLADSLLANYTADLNELERRTAAVFGEPGIELLNMAYKRASMKREISIDNLNLQKQAAWQDGPVYNEVKYAMELVDQVNKETEELRKLQKQALIGSILRPLIYGKIMSGSKNDDDMKSLDQLADVDTEAKQLKAQRILNELIANDPVISRHDPHVVVLTYNDLVELAPSIATDPVVLRMALRKALEGERSLDPFDINTLVGYEKEKAKYPSAISDVVSTLETFNKLRGKEEEKPQQSSVDVLLKKLPKSDKSKNQES